MKKFLITLFSSLLLVSAGIAMAQGPGGGPGHKARQHKGGMQAMPAVERVMRAIRRLDLDEEQRAAIKSVMQGLKENVRPLMAETKANHEQLKGLVTAINFEEDAAAEIAKKEGALAAERLMLTSRALSDVYKVLTREQRDELEAMAAQRQAKQSGKRQRKGKGQDTDEG
ncbi:MAG: Spy/CpxP family protein refolding chaperone [Gammaproteobacteria bacterium]|nr:Spy/CpxP family protein refolding chaperone [Gammaproteobacteria bacterium]